MARIDMERAKALFKTAKNAYESGEVAGVTGLSCQAAEAAFISLAEEMNGHDPGTHASRRKRAEELLVSGRNRTDAIWKARNVDFYGNTKLGGRKRRVTPKMAYKALVTVEKIIDEVETLLAENP